MAPRLSTRAACARLFDLMDIQPSLVRPEPVDPYLALQAQMEAEERVLSGSVLAAAPRPAGVSTQT